MSEDKTELIQSRIEADRSTYSKLLELAEAVFNDPNSRLPYIPQFYRNRKNAEEQFNFLDETYPKVLQARGEEFCLQACNKKSNDCLAECHEFTFKAFDIGDNIFNGLHKPYTYATPTLQVDE